MSIYDKSDYENISDTFLKSLINEIQKELKDQDDSSDEEEAIDGNE